MKRITMTMMAALAAASMCWATPEPRADWQETIAAGESEKFAGIAAEINRMQSAAAADEGTGVQRGFHAKAHAGMRAELRVLDGLPEPYRQGAFAQPRLYPAWVRFSNGAGRAKPDRSPDVRGFAVKLSGVAGDPLTEGLDQLDLICINGPVSSPRNIDQFMAFVRAAANPLTMPVTLAKAVGVAEATRILAHLALHLGERVTSLATLDYYTVAPLRWGPYAAKVRFHPQNAADAAHAATGDASYLRHDLARRLSRGDLRWDVMVQLYTDARATPIEDASVEWSSPWVKVGELSVRAHDLETPESVAEENEANRMAWNPWHAPVEHRPLGSLMRARRVVYEASAKLRQSTNR